MLFNFCVCCNFVLYCVTAKNHQFTLCLRKNVTLLPERDYVTFGSLLSQIRLSVVCLSSVCNVGAPYSGG